MKFFILRIDDIPKFFCLLTGNVPMNNYNRLYTYDVIIIELRAGNVISDNNDQNVNIIMMIIMISVGIINVTSVQDGDRRRRTVPEVVSHTFILCICLCTYMYLICLHFTYSKIHYIISAMSTKFCKILH